VTEKPTGEVPSTEKIPWQGYIVGIVLISYFFIGIIAVISIHLDSYDILKKSALLRTHFFCASFGFLGATIALIRKYYKHLITLSNAQKNKKFFPQMDWSFGWVYYYFVRPLLGALLGALTYTLSLLGFQILAKPQQIAISGEGRILLFAIAFLTGFSVSDVLDRLSSTAKQMFAKKEN
jgi:hypothetical protein